MPDEGESLLRDERRRQLQQQQLGSNAAGTPASASASPPEWSHINWSTTYSSDEDSSHTSASSRFLGERPPRGRADDFDGGDDLGDDDPLLAAPSHDEVDGGDDDNGGGGLPVGSFEDETIRTARTPPRTRRRTRSSHRSADAPLHAPPVDTVVLLPKGRHASHHLYGDAAPALPADCVRPRPALRARGALVVLGLVCTFLVLGVHPDNNSGALLPRPPPSEGVSGRHAPTGALLQVAHRGPPKQHTGAEDVDQRHHHLSHDVQHGPRLMHALPAPDGASLSFRRRPTFSSAPAIPLFVGHVAYVSFLLAVIGWSIREVRREVRARRDHDEPVCCRCCDGCDDVV